MTGQPPLPTLPDYGFSFDPPSSLHETNHRRLTVVIHAIPTRRHFDPEIFQVDVVGKDGDLERLKVFHPWPYLGHYRVCGGPVVLTDRKKKEVDAVSFGGELKIDTEEDCTTCVLQSPVPILARLVGGSVSSLLAEEVGILFAERRAVWDMKHGPPDGFQQRLATASPTALYVACLAALDQKFRQALPDNYAPFTHIGDFLRAEIEAMQASGAGPLSVPSLDEIL